jgi:hypothetical protein
MHVRDILETTLEENLAMIRDSIAYLKSHGLTVFFDAEHFFDGFGDNPDYALDCLRAAVDAGVDCLVLCDTNGGTITSKLVEAVATVRALNAPVGIHAHNDADLASTRFRRRRVQRTSRARSTLRRTAATPTSSAPQPQAEDRRDERLAHPMRSALRYDRNMTLTCGVSASKGGMHGGHRAVDNSTDRRVSNEKGTWFELSGQQRLSS